MLVNGTQILRGAPAPTLACAGRDGPQKLTTPLRKLRITDHLDGHCDFEHDGDLDVDDDDHREYRKELSR